MKNKQKFKKEYYEPKTSFPSRNILKTKNCTEITNHMWKLRNEGTKY